MMSNLTYFFLLFSQHFFKEKKYTISFTASLYLFNLFKTLISSLFIPVVLHYRVQLLTPEKSHEVRSDLFKTADEAGNQSAYNLLKQLKMLPKVCAIS